ncbi:hypothetical protein [Corynebacterium pilosum]|uniref:hypothetical protein n=1 Tax=Corynebacterium pilosum TaxID=35756 RepID=UPI00065294EC|nr:hypothetical protein [Corynebacterium pilosum]
MRRISRRSLTIATATALTFTGITAPTTFAADFGPKSTPDTQKTCDDKLLLDYGHIDIQMLLDENNDVDVKIKDETAIHGSLWRIAIWTISSSASMTTPFLSLFPTSKPSRTSSWAIRNLRSTTCR